jgi:Flp pilus assembly pilin Flp
MFQVFHVIQTLMLSLILSAWSRLVRQERDERGAGAVEWLVVLGAGIAIAYFAGDSVMAFAKSLVGGLGE